MYDVLMYHLLKGATTSILALEHLRQFISTMFVDVDTMDRALKSIYC